MQNSTVKRGIEILKEQRYFDSIQGLMGWDLWAGLSKNGQPYRSEVSSYFTRQSLSLLKSSETAKIVAQLEELSDTAFNSPYEKAAATALIDRYTKATQIPDELQIELRSYTQEAQRAWQDAIKINSYDSYKPWIKGLFELKTKIALAVDPNANPFDTLCGMVDKGMDTKEVGRIFGALKVGINDILSQIKDEHEKIDTSILDITATKQQIRDLAAEINTITGYDYDNGRDSETVHGMCTGVGPRDSRIAISYHGLWNTIFTMLHEGGHGRYNYGSCDEAVQCGVWGGVSGAMHEGIAKFYENQIGRSYEFIKLIYPTIIKHFPQMEKVSPHEFYKAVNKVKPGLVRLSADELTYSLHPIIRFELEQDYFNGKLKTDDFMEAWDAKYLECLGIKADNVKQGVLQDIHYSSGHIGYFQSYTLGNLYDGQFLSAIIKKTPDVYAQIEKGNFAPINNWMQENIFQYGSSLYTPTELLVNATGEKLNEKHYLDYLKNKYLGK